MKLQENILLTSAKFMQQKRYWLEKLNIEITQTSLLSSNKDSKGSEMMEIKIPLKTEVLQRINEISKGSDLSTYVILLTNLKILLEKYCQTENNSIITPLYKVEEVEEPKINDFVILLDDKFNSEDTFKTYLFQIKKTVSDAIENQDYPMIRVFNQLIEEGRLNLEVDALTNVAFVYKNIHELETINFQEKLLLFSFEQVDGTLTGSICFNSLLYDQSLVQNLTENFSSLLENCLVDVNCKITELDFLSESEKSFILTNSIGKKEPLQVVSDIIDLFEKQVKATPDLILLTCDEGDFSYNEINKEANTLANFLIDQQVKTNDVVAIITDSPKYHLLGVIASLKVGATFLPIEMTLPQKRILTILEDSNAKIVLSTSQNIKDFSFTKLSGLYDLELAKIVTNPRPQLSFEELPHPDRSLVNYTKYHSFIGEALAQHTMTIQSTRGCPYLCTFCHKIFPKTHVHRSAQNLFDEVKKLYDIGVRRFEFVDDIFNLVQDNAAKFMQLVIDHDMKIQMYFTNGLKGDLLTEDFIDLMVKAGTVDFDFSLETGSPRLQKVIKKYLRVDKLKEKIQYILDKHPHVIVEVQTLHGIPTETEEEAMMTLDFIKDIKWIDFPYVHILKIFPGTDMAKVAIENGISEEAIIESSDLAYHELSETLPFSKEFATMYRAKYFNEYFMNKERFKVVLPKQMKILTPKEIVQKYNSFFPQKIESFDDLLNLIGLTMEDLGNPTFLPDNFMAVDNIDEKLAEAFLQPVIEENAVKILLLDLTQYYTGEVEMLYDVVNEPLGLMYLLSNLKHEFGGKINGKIAKSRLDFNSNSELKKLIEEFKPDVIGIRGMDFYKEFFHRTIELIRQWDIKIPIVAGGPYSSDSYHFLLNDKNVDIAVLGEGEETFNEIIHKMILNQNQFPSEEILNEIKGIVYVSNEEKESKELKRKVILLDELNEKYSKFSNNDLKLKRENSDNAYVIYTSGSSGKPKGVVVSNGNLNNYINAFNSEFNISSNDVILKQASFAFDTSIEEMLPILTKGGKIAAIDKKKILNIPSVIDYIDANKISILDSSPLYINEINNLYDESKLNSLRLVISGGDSLKSNYVSSFKNIDVYNTYGPSETTICATYHKVSDASFDKINVPIGRPILNSSVYLLNDELCLVPVGNVGEIYIAGSGVSKGYLGLEEYTSEKFIQNPFNTDEILYKSGDLGKLNSNGEIEFLGRKDRQISLRGYRIELEEIENQLLKKDGVKDAIVTLSTINGVEHLIGYYVASKKLENSALKDFLLKVVPEFMVPTYLIEIIDIPLTSNGKIDYGSLPKPDSNNNIVKISFDEMEKLIQSPHLKFDFEDDYTFSSLELDEN